MGDGIGEDAGVKLSVAVSGIVASGVGVGSTTGGGGVGVQVFVGVGITVASGVGVAGIVGGSDLYQRSNS